MKFISAALAILFIAWAAFQYNDPDPFLWILVYGLAALASVLFLVNRLPLSFPLSYLIICVVWAVFLSTQITYQELSVAVRECEEEMDFFVAVCSWIPRQITSEYWREMMGLVTIAVWMGVLGLTVFVSNKKKSGS